MTKPTWVLIADGGRARLLSTPRIKADGNYVQVAAYDNADALAAAPSTDRPGRSFESANSTRHAVAEYSDQKKQPKLEFADHLADILNKGATSNDYERLLIVAPPTLIGRLRAALSDAASGRLIGSLDKDLTHVALEDLPSHLAGVAG